jgi:hypothetical protein
MMFFSFQALKYRQAENAAQNHGSVVQVNMPPPISRLARKRRFRRLIPAKAGIQSGSPLSRGRAERSRHPGCRLVNKTSRRCSGFRANRLRAVETCHASVPVMSATRDQIGISSIGIPSIMPTAEMSRRLTKRKPEDDRDPDDARTESHDASPSPAPPGTGRLVDKAV